MLQQAVPENKWTQNDDLAKLARFALPFPIVIADNEIKTKRFALPIRMALFQIIPLGFVFAWILFPQTSIHKISSFWFLGGILTISVATMLVLIFFVNYVFFAMEHYRFSNEGYQHTNGWNSWCLYRKTIPLEKIVRVEVRTNRFDPKFTQLAIITTGITETFFIGNVWDYPENNVAFMEVFATIVNKHISQWKEEKNNTASIDAEYTQKYAANRYQLDV
ncbi:MAG: hypothetical protein ACRCUY_10180 [Thermoguttaceae bacterium]